MYDDDLDPTFDPIPAPESPTGSPAGGTTGSKARRAVTGVAIGLAVLTTGGVAIAATHTGSNSSGGGPGGAGGFGGAGGPSGVGGPSGTVGARGDSAVAYTALHGTFVVPGTGRTATVTNDLQRGVTSTVSATSIRMIGSGMRIDTGRDVPARIARGDSILAVATSSSGTALRLREQSLSAAAGGGASRSV